MSEVTGRLVMEFSERRMETVWRVRSNDRVPWSPLRRWDFRRRIDAVAFAKRKGIRLEAE